jgi:GT2 family glycosyltransferase
VLFKNEKVFAVSGKALMPDKKTFLSGASSLRFKWGLTWISRDIDEARINKTSLNFRASGGHSAFDREKFLKLGGFDSLFRPFYCEDEDICYRAWKTGWLVLYEPKSIVFHQPQSTIGKAFKKGQIESIMRRNRFLFIWKNIFDKKLLFKHLFFLPFQLIMAPIVGRYRFTLAFFMALSRLEEVVNKRRHEDVHQLKDSDVIDRLSSLQRIEDAQV